MYIVSVFLIAGRRVGRRGTRRMHLISAFRTDFFFAVKAVTERDCDSIYQKIDWPDKIGKSLTLKHSNSA